MTMDELDIWANQDGDELPPDFFEGLPIPIYWRVLVMPKAAQKKTKSGIVLAQAAQEAQQHLCYIGQILAAGGEAFKSERFANEKNLPKVGDWIIYGRYAGQRLEYKGVKLLIVNDDDILAVASDPHALRVHV
jgi:chaperonin GroES